MSNLTCFLDVVTSKTCLKICYKFAKTDFQIEQKESYKKLLMSRFQIPNFFDAIIFSQNSLACHRAGN